MSELFYNIDEEVEEKEEKKNPIFEKLEEIERKEDKALLTQENYKEKISAFADGLPEWSIEPLQIVVKRGR